MTTAVGEQKVPEETLEEVTKERDRLKSQLVITEHIMKGIRQELDSLKAPPSFTLNAAAKTAEGWDRSRTQILRPKEYNGGFSVGWFENHSWGQTQRQLWLPKDQLTHLIVWSSQLLLEDR